MPEKLFSTGSTEAIVLIKPGPQVGQRHGETVCCAGIDLYGRWLRLYPVSFRHLEESQKFGRWDRIKFNWRMPKTDPRPESRRVDQQSIQIVGSLKNSEKQKFLGGAITHSLVDERAKGRSLALLKPEILEFRCTKKTSAELTDEEERFANLRAQGDLFSSQTTPRRPCPYKFQYAYRTVDGERLSTCQDWEMEATYSNWSRSLGEAKAIAEMKQVFGENYPKKGMLLAMGTHSQYPDTWLINGVIRLDDVEQSSLF